MKLNGTMGHVACFKSSRVCKCRLTCSGFPRKRHRLCKDVTTRLRWDRRAEGLVYHDLYLGGKALVERENVGFDLTKSDLCPSLVEDLTAKGVGLCVADSHTGNHREDDFTPLETIRRFLGIVRSRSLSSSKGKPSGRRGGASLNWLCFDAISNILTPSLSSPDGVARIPDAVSTVCTHFLLRLWCRVVI
ncbi:hypothetical protein Tco_0294838 [Tanacetum coccineum]